MFLLVPFLFDLFFVSILSVALGVGFVSRPFDKRSRWKTDIYSAEVVGARKARHVEEVHTKALYKLRRFSAHVKEAVEARGA